MIVIFQRGVSTLKPVAVNPLFVGGVATKEHTVNGEIVSVIAYADGSALEVFGSLENTVDRLNGVPL